MYKYLGILDFEANCLEHAKINPQEIIEFPIIVYNLETQKIERHRDFHYYCKPTIKLTRFCTKLTGITQDMVNNGEEFNNVLGYLYEWMTSNGFLDYSGNCNMLFVTCGDWDLRTMLPNQC